MIENHHKNIATFIHLSTFSRFVIPLGNFIAPILIWSLNKNKSAFINSHGKQIINFQMSVLLYTLVIGMLTIPFFIFKFITGIEYLDFNGFENFHFNIGEPSPLLYFTGILGVLAVFGFLLELVLIVVASLKARDGELYQYPLTISFLK